MKFDSKGKIAKVPVILQLEALECGAACLAMVMSYYGKYVPLEEVRIACGVSRDGSKASRIVQAARNYGMEAAGFRADADALEESIQLPCIIFWESRHFVVLCGIKKGRYYINDPSDGKVILKKEEFLAGYSGICLQMTPTDAFERTGKRQSILGFAMERMKQSRRAVMTIIALTIAGSMVGLAKPYFEKNFADGILKGNGNLSLFLILFAIFAVLRIFLARIRSGIVYAIGGKLETEASTGFFRKVLELPLSFFSQRTSGSIVNRLIWASDVSRSVVYTTGPVIIECLMLVVYLVLMAIASFPLTLVAVMNFIVTLITERLSASPRVNAAKLTNRDNSALFAKTANGIEIIETIKALGCEESFMADWNDANRRYGEKIRHSGIINAALNVIPGMIRCFANGAVLGLGALFIIKGEFTIGSLMAFSGLMTSFLGPVDTILSANQTLEWARSDLELIEDILKHDSDPVIVSQSKAAETSAKLGGGLKLDHVSFGYSPLDTPVINDICMDIKQGQRIAIVGSSGSGKSTISKLICGLYLPSEGQITFGGKTVSEIPREVFTGSVAIVDQDITLFADTIKNNIKLWDESIEDFAMILAARDACLHDMISARPKGYDTKLGSGGQGLSGGEKQRLEIARALAQEPSILILDEAFSALDAVTESRVMQKIRDCGMTCIVIAHRLSTIRDCDCIYVLDKGRIAEQGTHEELIAQNGIYKALVSEQ